MYFLKQNARFSFSAFVWERCTATSSDRENFPSLLNSSDTYSFMFFLQCSSCRIHLRVSLQKVGTTSFTNLMPHYRVPYYCVTDKVFSFTFWTWLISSCLRFWFLVIFLSVLSARSVTTICVSPCGPLSSIRWFKSTLSSGTHSSRRRLTTRWIICICLHLNWIIIPEVSTETHVHETPHFHHLFIRFTNCQI